MKRLFITIFVLVGAVTFANAQIVRSAGVVRKTEHKVEKVKKSHVGLPYKQELKTFTHSAGIVLGWDEYGDSIFGLDYNIQYRFSPLLSAGAGIWAGKWWPFGITSLHHIGFEPRVNVKCHFLATKFPDSKYQPYVALWLGTFLSRYQYTYYGGDNGIISDVIFTPEIGCDLYHNGRTWFASVSFTQYREYEQQYSFNEYYSSNYNDWTIFNIMFRCGMRF